MLALGVLLPLVPAFVVVERALGRTSLLLKALVALLLAISASSAVFYLYLPLRGSARGYPAFDVSFWSLLGAGALWWRWRHPRPTLTGKRVSGPVFEMPRLKARDFRRIWAAKFIGTRLL